MSAHPLPPEGEAWLRKADAHLQNLDPVQRREVMDGIRAHILDALESGDGIDVVLARLGDPAAVADDAVEWRATGHAPERRAGRYWDTARVLQIVAFALTLGGILAVGFLPLGSEVTEIDGELVVTTNIGFVSIVYWSPDFLGTMLAALVSTLVPVTVPGARLVVAVITTALLIVITAIGIVTIGNWLLAPPTLASAAATILLATRSPRRANSTTRAAVGA